MLYLISVQKMNCDRQRRLYRIRRRLFSQTKDFLEKRSAGSRCGGEAIVAIATRRRRLKKGKDGNNMSVNVAEVFGMDVFNDTAMKERLPKSTYRELTTLMEEGGEISMELAEVVAEAMKDWAVAKGATHFTHLFQPYSVTNQAEKHDSFVGIPKDGKIMVEFSGKDLLMGEPDASSFPSGGLRATCAARGYTAWDITSPAYVREDCLYIPTAFCSYTGESLDTRTPLLRSMETVSREGIRMLRALGNTTSKKLVSCVGPEQEYFLVDRELYLKRPDLINAGRTLYGAAPSKGQELSDYYFGTINTRVKAFMTDVNEQLWKLGITAKTEHNEVAPGQHEVAPIFSVTNVALDTNLLVMDILKKTAPKYGFACLLHEKPYAGVNGSGKHNNWSLTTDDGINLFKPGKEPHKNTTFLLSLACVMSAVDKHALLMRAAASDAGNDHRLGANEAPPAIISIFMGDQLGDIINQIIEKGYADHCVHNGTLDLGVSTLPILEKDPTDRNRTSPFAFTGNRFEFRMVASNNSIAPANTVLNTMMTEAFADAADILEAADDVEAAAKELIRKLMVEHQRVFFNGNGYSEEWVEEAARRGLPNVKTLVEALSSYTAPENVAMFERFNVLSEKELAARETIGYDNYSKQILIEAKTMVEMANKMIIPAGTRYARRMAETINVIRTACGDEADISVEKELLIEVSDLISDMKIAAAKVSDTIETASAMSSEKEQAYYVKDAVIAAMAELRAPADKMETIVEKDYWPMPTYGDLLFEV